MYLRKLSLTNMRAFRAAEFDFLGKEGVHLIVGINGVGKSTALEALRISLAQALRKIEKSIRFSSDFTLTDIASNQDEMEIEVEFEAGNVNFVYTRKKFSAVFLPNPDKPAGDPDFLRITKPVAELKPAFNVAKRLYNDSTLPLLIFFSPLRSVVKPVTLKQLAKTGQPRHLHQNPAYDNAFVSRPSRLIDFYYWVRVLEDLSKESQRHLLWRQKLEDAVRKFLPQCTNLRTATHIINRTPALLLDKNDDTFDVLQLSDGERGILALVLEITLRLAQANPDSNSPNDEASAIILIDELDLHLHPGWQRDIVGKLESTFPKCQFIVSTHSAQIIGEVPHDRVTWILPGEKPFKRPQAYGLESGWIIEFLMGVPNRNLDVKKTLDSADENLAARNFPAARLAIKTARELMNGSDGELTELEAATESLEDLYDDAEDNKVRPTN